MKSYREIADSVFARRDEYVIRQRKKKQAITRATASVGSVALVSLAGFALFKNDAFRETPPISNGKPTTTATNVPTEMGDTTAPTTGTQTAAPTITAPTTAPSKTEATKTTAPSTTEPPATTTSETKSTITTTAPTKLLITADEPDNDFANQGSFRKKGKYISKHLRQWMEVYEGYDVMYAVAVSLPITSDDWGEDFWISNEEYAKVRQEYFDARDTFNQEAKRLNPTWDGHKLSEIEVWTEELRELCGAMTVLCEKYLYIEENCKEPYIKTVLEQRYVALEALSEKEPVDICSKTDGHSKVGFHVYYVELTAEDIHALAEYGGYVFYLATSDQKDYVDDFFNH